MSGDSKQLPRGMIKPTMAARITQLWWHMRGHGLQKQEKAQVQREIIRKTNPYWFVKTTWWKDSATGARQGARISRQIAKGQLTKSNGLVTLEEQGIIRQ